jgi:hypothetical protein
VVRVHHSCYVKTKRLPSQKNRQVCGVVAWQPTLPPIIALFVMVLLSSLLILAYFNKAYINKHCCMLAGCC